MTAWQYWLSIAKPKNVFRSTLNLCITLLWNFRKFFNQQIFLLTDYLMPPDKRNSITAKAMGLISTLFNVISSRDVPFANRCSYNACIMVLPKLTFAFFCFWFLSPLPRRWRFAVTPLGRLSNCIDCRSVKLAILLLKTFCTMLDNSENEA